MTLNKAPTAPLSQTTQQPAGGVPNPIAAPAAFNPPPQVPIGLQGRYWALLGGLGLNALALLVFIAEAGRWIGDANSLLNGNGDAATVIDTLGATSAVNGAETFVYVSSIAATVCFLIWFFAAYKNLQTAGKQLRYSTGMSIGAWFIPFANFVLPKNITNDLWRGSHSARSNTATWRGAPVSALIHWWWGTWVAGTVLWAVGIILAADKGSAFDSLGHVIRLERTGFYLAIVGALAWGASAVLIILASRQMIEAQLRNLLSE